MKKSIIPYFLVGLAGAFLLYFILNGFPKIAWKSEAAAKLLVDEAQALYVNGEKAKTVADRKQAFNQALEKYTQLVKRYQPDYGNGKLYYNLANVNYELGEYAWAVYYYYKALKLAPQDEEARHNLALALKKLDVPVPAEASPLQKIFFIHFLPTPLRLLLFFIVGCMAFGSASLLIWTHFRGLKTACVVATAALLLLLCSLLYTRYLAPPEAVVVRSAMMYRDAGEQYAQVSDKPIPAGLKVEVLDVRQQGHWLKIQTPDGVLGYVQYENLRLL